MCVILSDQYTERLFTGLRNIEEICSLIHNYLINLTLNGLSNHTRDLLNNCRDITPGF